MKITLLMILLLSGTSQATKIHPIISTQGPFVVPVNPDTLAPKAPKQFSLEDPYDAAAIHIAAQQCPNGGFGWPYNNCDTTYHNITPPIIDGIRQAYLRNPNMGYLGVMLNSGDYALTNEYASNQSPRLGAFTAYFLWNLSHDSGDNIYRDFSEQGFFEALSTGTYGEQADMDTADWITSVETSRTGTWVNLRPWEFSNLILTAHRHCRDIQSGEFEQAIYRGLGTLDNTDPDNVYSDNIGVAGGLLGLASIQRPSFPAINAPLHAGVHGISTLEALADYLVSQQNMDGSFYWHSNLPAPTEADKDTQTTAYATLALIKANEALVDNDYLPAINAAQEWILGLQEQDGGFPSFPGDTDRNTEVEAEALSAIATQGVYDRIYRGNMECYLY